MLAVADARREAALWELWANAAFNLIYDLQSRDPAAARVLLDAMRGVAEARNESSLWEWWAKASFSLIIALGSRDPAASRALVGDMLKAVERHPWQVGGWQIMVLCCKN